MDETQRGVKQTARGNPGALRGRKVEMENAVEFCKKMRQVLNSLSEIVKEDDYDGKKGKEFLSSCFGTDKDLFCQFVGFARVEIKTTRIPKPVAVDIFTEIAMAGISLGWDEGYASAKRIYRAA